MHGYKILFLGQFTGFAGGIERYAHQTAALLRHHGSRVDWCGREPARGEALFRRGFDAVLTPDQLADNGYDLAAIHKLPDLETLLQWRRMFGERLVFWAHDHDLYCPRRHYYIPFGRINCHRAYNACLCAVCARISAPRNWKFLRRGQSALLRELRGHRAVVLSEFMSGNLQRNGFAQERIHRIPPVIETSEPASAAAAGPLKILFLGQLIRGKGADLLLDSLRRLTIPWQAKIAGDGLDRAMLEGMARDFGLSGNIEFPGWLTDPGSALEECDVAVFPSRWQEPFGLAGAEASAHGKPVAAFDVGGVREWLEDGVTGFAVPEKNTAALTEKLELLYRDPALRLRMGQAGRELIRTRFAPEHFLAGFHRLIEPETRS